jgi:hypothetical protein
MDKKYRIAKNVSGGAKGSPNLATMNPVLQMSTKTAGMERMRVFDGLLGDI